MDPRIRVGDDERDRAVTALGDHYAQGRLTRDEHDERLHAAWTARTRADLDALFHDLPRSWTPAPPPAPALAVAARRRRGFPLPVVVAIVVFFALLGIVTHLPLVLVGLLALVFWRTRHRRRRQLTWRS